MQKKFFFFLTREITFWWQKLEKGKSRKKKFHLTFRNSILVKDPGILTFLFREIFQMTNETLNKTLKESEAHVLEKVNFAFHKYVKKELDKIVQKFSKKKENLKRWKMIQNVTAERPPSCIYCVKSFINCLGCFSISNYFAEYVQT